jgi:hypothetical protein
MFYNEGTFSLTEYIFSILPDEFGIGALVKLIMNTNIFQFFFKEMKEEIGLNKRIDLRCSFNRDYLN